MKFWEENLCVLVSKSVRWIDTKFRFICTSMNSIKTIPHVPKKKKNSIKKKEFHPHPLAHSLSVNPRVPFSVTRGQPQPLGVSELHWARSGERLCQWEQHSDPRHPLPVHTRFLRTCSHGPAVCQGNSLLTDARSVNEEQQLCAISCHFMQNINYEIPFF